MDRIGPDGPTRCDHQNGDPAVELSQDDLIRTANAARVDKHLRHQCWSGTR